MVTSSRALVIAAPGSGHGKTSVATGLLAALRERGLTVSPHKVGPDYIDPGYHALAAGRPGRNLDPWLVGEDRIVPLFACTARDPGPADIAVIEGVMGLFDGVASGASYHGASDHGGDFASTAHVARLLAAPVVLVVDAHGISASAAALLHGFTTFDPGTRIGGVIFNKAGSPRHEELLRAAADAAGVPVLGVLRRRDQLTVPSRHLGLIPAAELGGQAAGAVAALAAVIAASVDLDAVLRLARSAGPLPGRAGQDQDSASERLRHPLPRPRVAIAGGARVHLRLRRAPRAARGRRRRGRDVRPAAGREPARRRGRPGHRRRLPRGARRRPVGQRGAAGGGHGARAGRRPRHRRMRGPALPGPLP